jgi:hypothetical protein
MLFSMNREIVDTLTALLPSDGPLSMQISLLSRSEQELLALLIKYEMITKQTWELLCQDAASIEQYSRAMWSLTKRKWVVARPLHDAKMYFVLSKDLVAKFGLPTQRSKPMAHATRFRKYAQLLYQTKYEPSAYRLDRDQVETMLGQVVVGMPLRFVKQRRDEDRISFMRIDQATNGSSKHAAQAIRKDVYRLIGFEAVRQRLKQRKFDWTWITATQSRADAVLAAFRQYEIGKAPVNVLVFNELVPLLIPKETRS